MATMIPEKPFSENVRKSPAEGRVFELFKNAPDDWIVLHSYRVITGDTNTEIDFVVLAPGLGIFGIEVKGGAIGRDNVGWYHMREGRKKYDDTDPFKQAENGIRGIMNNYINRMWRDLAFGYGVMFPDINFNITGIEVDQCQIFDKKNNDNVVEFIERLSEKAHYKKPSQMEVLQIADLLRGNIKPELNDLIEIAEKGLIRLTKDQINVLDLLKGNTRILIEGSAGTGKTILAIEAAKRAAKQGKKVAIFCYNMLIAEWIKKQVESEVNIVANTIHDFMISHIKLSGFSFAHEGRNFFEDWETIKKNQKNWTWELDPWPKGMYDGSDFWERCIPQKMIEALGNNSIEFDKIILDEAQDLIKGDYLDVIDKLLKGGLLEGSWIMFADFNQDVIRIENTPEKAKNIIRHRGEYTECSLRENCRNTIAIGKQIEMLMGFDIKYRFTDIDCPEVRFELWPENKKELQTSKLAEILKELIDRNGIDRKEIVILLRTNKSLLSESARSKLRGFTFNPYGTENPGEIAFTTARRFKGMESPVVILMDVDSYGKENDNVKNMMYVGLSRARSLLIVLESKKAKEERENVANTVC